ncbi:MAG TPA: HAMP domain-containing sensor histidine kinase [Luteibacter sp.]|nr:HAMP domain-containing sensor histidine kinase [Luteibacter sp.]
MNGGPPDPRSRRPLRVVRMQVWLFLRAMARFETTMFTRTRYSQPKMVAIGVVGCFSLAIYYPVWAFLFPQPYENLPLRLACSAVFIPLALLPWWPRRWRAYLPTYWYIAMTLSMPFFVGYMTLRNGTPAWLMTHLAVIMLLMMLFDVASFVIVFIVGSLVATAAYLVAPHEPLRTEAMIEYIPLMLFAMMGGAVCSVSSTMAEQARLDALTAASNNIAHELRTPLGSLRIAAKAIGRFLPDLVRSHQLAQDNGLDVPEIRDIHLQALDRSVGVMEREVTYSNTIIDMLLLAARPIGEVPLVPLSVRECLEQALQRYPYGSRDERERVADLPAGDFTVLASESLLVHVVFNLIRNALHHIGRAGKGEITIAVETGPKSNRILVHDTGPGIPPDVLPRIFDRFYSHADDDHGVAGLGIGLAFSRAAMEHMGGAITCRSRWGEFTEFTLTFPIPDIDRQS